MVAVSAKSEDRSCLAHVNKLNAWKILPILLLGYVLNSIDKSNIGFAGLEMNKALGFSPAVFGLGAGLFFIPYTLLELPSNLLLRRFGARKWLSRILISWGLIAMAMALIYNETSFYILRLLLGAAEAGWFPGVLFYLSLWFPGDFRARAVMLFFLGSPLAAVVGSPISGALLSLPPTLAGLANWQWLFIIEGLPSFILGFVLLAVLKDKPAEATWLTADQKARLARTIEAEKSAGGDHHAIGSWRAVFTPQLMLFSLVNLLSGIGLYGTFIWIPRLIKDFGGLTNLEIGFIAAAPFLFASIALATSAYSSDRLRERKWHVAGMFFVGGCALAAMSHSTSPLVAMVFLTIGLVGVFGVQGVFFAMVIEALSGPRNRLSLAAGLAIVTTCGNIGGFVGPGTASASSCRRLVTSATRSWESPCFTGSRHVLSRSVAKACWARQSLPAALQARGSRFVSTWQLHSQVRLPKRRSDIWVAR